MGTAPEVQNRGRNSSTDLLAKIKMGVIDNLVGVNNVPLVEISRVKRELSEEQKVKISNAVSDLLIGEMLNLPKETISVMFYENPSENLDSRGEDGQGIETKKGNLKFLPKNVMHYR